MASASEHVTLKGGAVASLDALRLLWALEDRGCVLRRNADGSLFVGPRALVDGDELDRIRRHKAELLALLDSCQCESVM
jgi:hypothetical protein